ncbi:hypothetical protein NKJ40_06905 [Mesorhizobium sp. M0119]|uniref:hypothetical protein n=1 Tax=Mesorhizobium sp. M0119 TaxID=2956885 RepID=UPI00333795F8
MSQQPVHAVSGRLILLIKSGYWLALLIIAAMVMASFILLQQVMATQRHNQALLDIVSTQKALSQRIVFLAGATGSAQRDQQRALVTALKQATVEFEKNYDLLLERTAADPVSPARFDPKSIESVLFAKPYHLDYFSVGLIANGERLIFIRIAAQHDRQRRLQGRRGARQPERFRCQRNIVGLRSTRPAHQRLRGPALRKAPRSSSHIVLLDHRRHPAGGTFHFPADVERHPAPDARAGRCAQFHGLHCRA